MNRKAVVVASLLLLALLAGLWWRRKAEGDAGKQDSPTGGASKPARQPSDRDSVAPAPGDARQLHGLRLLPLETARARGWKPPPPPEESKDPAWQTWKRLRQMKIDLRAEDQTVAAILLDLETKYGLRTRLDPAIDAGSYKMSYAALELSADNVLDLVLKMAGLAWCVDSAGEIWVTSKERATELAAPAPPDPDEWSSGFGAIRGVHSIKSKGGPSARTAPPWKGMKVSVTIVRKPLPEAWDALMTALQIQQYGWTSACLRDEAREAAASAIPVSLLAEDMPAEEAVAKMLGESGLELDPHATGAFGILTPMEERKRREVQEAARLRREEEAKELAAFRLRRVKIQGDFLTASDVVGQVAAQLGVTLRAAPDIALCAALWESDGLEQTAGEVLDIVARDGKLLWRWHGEVDQTGFDLHFGPCFLWVLGIEQ